PTTSDAALAVSVFSMMRMWILKRQLARLLNSGTMNGEGMYTLSCMQFSIVLLVGPLLYRV
ncbi:hypothetical protein SCLCIDRAFT_102971, partial [Scleroderma citrinum Foug A]